MASGFDTTEIFTRPLDDLELTAEQREFVGDFEEELPRVVEAAGARLLTREETAAGRSEAKDLLGLLEKSLVTARRQFALARRPSSQVHRTHHRRATGRAARLRSNHRRSGSRRNASRGSPSSDDPDLPPKPAVATAARPKEGGRGDD